MNALKRRNPLTESFLVQLNVDLEVLGGRIPKLRNAFPVSTESVSPNDHCFSSRDPNSVPQPPPRNVWEQQRGAECQPTSDKDGAGSKGTAGTTAYRNECQFLRMAEDDGNPINAPDLSATETPDTSAAGVSQTPSSSTGIGSQSWHGADRGGSLPTRKRGSGTSPYPHVIGLLPVTNVNVFEMTSSPNGTSGTPPEGQSSGLSPNSGSSDPRQNSNLAPGQAGLRNSSSSGRTSFEASPATSSSHNPHIPSKQPAAQTADADAAAAFFNDIPSAAGGFGLGGESTGLTPRFTMTDAAGANEYGGWEMSGQSGMTPGAEGVLGSILNMGSMDTMDMGWDPEIGLR